MGALIMMRRIRSGSDTREISIRSAQNTHTGIASIPVMYIHFIGNLILLRQLDQLFAEREIICSATVLGTDGYAVLIRVVRNAHRSDIDRQLLRDLRWDIHRVPVPQN